MKKITAAIFDLDGTLLDSMPMWMTCAERYISSLGMEAEAALGEKLFSMKKFLHGCGWWQFQHR